ncbi:hypothetical protein Tco_0317144 [Tanacetum coccineum]
MSENDGHNHETRHLNTAQFRPSLHNENGGKRVGMPLLSPSLQTECLQNLSLGNGQSHSRTSSQPSFFWGESLPPLSPSLYRENVSGPFSDHVVGDVSLPPRKTHRRSNGDIPFGFSTILQSSPPLILLRVAHLGFCYNVTWSSYFAQILAGLLSPTDGFMYARKPRSFVVMPTVEADVAFGLG